VRVPGPPQDPVTAFAALDVAGARSEVVAVGGTLEPATLAAAYRAGCFPWPAARGDEAGLERQLSRLVRRAGTVRLPGADRLVPWCSPDPRAVVLADALVMPRSLRQRLRHCGWTTTVDAAFDEVVAGCADRESTWITQRMAAAYGELHRAGPVAGVRAHSLEVWDGDRLVGGLYGLLVGRVFCGESMFNRERDASKVALVALCDRLLSAGVRVVDTQQDSEHLARLGQVLVRRDEFLDVLAVLRDQPARLAGDRRPVAGLTPAG
jgi:leucyl/phenylalanyl-tRNA---protein transferase